MDNYAFFMKTDMSQYIGEWVAICGDKVISHDASLKKSYEMAKTKCPDKKPLMAKVPTSEIMIL